MDDVCQIRCIQPEDVDRARALLLERANYVDLAAIFGALADPTRASLVHVLLRQEMCTCDLAAVLGVSDSAVSQHLRILRSLRLVKFRRAGKLVYYSLDDAHVAQLVRLGLSHLGHLSGGETLGSPAVAGATAV